MNTVLRLTLACALVAACGDDKDTTETTADQTTTGQMSTTATTGGTTDGPTTGTTTDATTGPATSEQTTSPATTDATTGPGTTTDATTSPATTTDATTGPGTTTDMTTGGGLSWEKDVYPVIVEGTCGCHAGGSGGLKMTNAMDSYANIVDVDATEVAFKRVAPGDPGNSYFLAKVAGTAGMAPFNSGSPAQMPKGGAPKGQMAIDLLTQWIAEGANP